MDIYISARPPYSPRLLGNEHERISRLSLHPTAPFRISLGMLSALGHDGVIKFVGTSEVPPPRWDGRSPIVLQFHYTWRLTSCRFLLALGLCTCRHPIGPHFITVQEDSELVPKDASHSCKEDHVKAGTTLRWQLKHKRLSQRSRPDLTPPHLQISLAKSRIDNISVNMLEVHLDLVHHSSDSGGVYQRG